MKQQGNLVALGIAVHDPEAAVHQVADRGRHQIPEPLVERRGEVPTLPGQTGKAAPIQARDQVQTRQRAMIVGGLEHPQPPIQLIKVHRAMLPR
jgi:hypothetical protein